jgi:hypothetical protein
MGMIILPVWFFWVAVFIYSLKLGFYIVTGDESLMYFIVAVLLAAFGTALYLQWGFSKFKNKESVWSFEIPWFFLFNQCAITLLSISAVIYFFADEHVKSGFLANMVFIGTFVASLGSLIGCFKSEKFMTKHGIRTTY